MTEHARHDRKVVDLIVDAASGREFYGIEGTIVSEAEALANYGDKGRAAYGISPSAAAMLSLLRRLPPLPAIVNTARTGYSILPREVAA